MNLQKQRRNHWKFSTINSATIFLFIIYLIALCWILVFKLGVRFSYMENRSVNLIPFNDPLILGKINAGEIIMNVLIFVPLGFYAEILFGKWIFWKKLFLIFLISLIVEGLQYVLVVGAFDITDIITNTLGGMIGLIICKSIVKMLHNRVDAQKFVNMIAVVGTALMILFFVFLKMDMLPVKYK